MAEKRTGEMICGCHYQRAQSVVFCKVHRAAVDALNMCRIFRRYFADTAKEAGRDPVGEPFVKSLDEMMARHGLGL